ncbi:ComEC/Rec2 family competence protein [Streptomyces sp. NPDC048197]|uniref:ComEC/Rec2 family competence protein n=1 Tax=Streptomyces sp. NPDC048197 TaxID=3365511 RepID=UPI00372150CA
MTSARPSVHATAPSPRGASDPQQEGPPDLRLAGPALAAWAAAAIGLGASDGGVAVACAVGVVLAALALWVAVLRRRAERGGGGEYEGERHGEHEEGEQHGEGKRHGEHKEGGQSGAGASAGGGAAGGTGGARGGGAGRMCRSGLSRRWASGAWVALAAVLLGAVAGAASAALHAADVRRGPLPDLADRYARVTVELEVTDDPRLTRPRVRGSQRTPAAVVFNADAVRVTAPDGAVTAVRTPALVLVRQSGRDEGAPSGSSGGEGKSTAAGAESTDGEGSGGEGPGGEGPGREGPGREAPGGKGFGGNGSGGEGSAGEWGRRGGRPASAASSLSEAWRGLLPSTRIRVVARAVPPLMPDDQVAAVLRVDADTPPVKVGGPSVLQRVAGRVRAGLREATDGLRPDARALLPGLVVGDTSRVPPDLDEAFRATDLTHLLAVSGSNLTIVLALLIGPPHLATRAERRGLAPRLRLSLRGTAVLGGVLALAFVVVCRPDPSVLRAAACGLITLLAIGTGRRRSLLPALAAAVLLLVLYDPWLARRYGFLLSVLATGALLLLAPRWSAALQRRRVPPRLAEVLAAAAAAQAVCAPVIVVLAARVGLVAVPCNLLAELAVGPATVLGFAALVTAPFVLPVAKALAWCAGWPTEWIAGVARTGAAFPGAEIGWPGGWVGALVLAAVMVALVPFGRRVVRRPWLCVLCACAVVLAVCRPAPFTRVITGWPPPGWRAVVCDVGQGDGLVLAAGDGTALVVDTGPEPHAIDRCLTELGIRRIPLLVLTHFHADHVDGLPGVLRGRSVGAIETTTLQDPPGQAQFVRETAARARIPLVRAVPGERRRLGPLGWEVLWPPAVPFAPVLDGPNDASVTLLVRTGGLTFLLLGDLEPPAQQALLAAHPELAGVDVLKVAHHGSAHQDPPLMHRLAPRLALISCGTGNPYGHPAPRTIAALRAQGARVLRTDTDGAIAILGTPGRLAATVTGRRTGAGLPGGRDAGRGRGRRRGRRIRSRGPAGRGRSGLSASARGSRPVGHGPWVTARGS